MTKLKDLLEEGNKIEDHLQCKQCDYSSSDWSNMRRHTENRHTPAQNNQIICKDCGKIYQTKMALQGHFKRIHYVPEGQTKCGKCLQFFPNENFSKLVPSKSN